MRGLLGRLGVRGVVVVAIVLLVLGVVTFARVAFDGRGDVTVDPGPAPASTVDPAEGDDGEVVPPATPGPEDLTVIGAADAFTKAWLRRDLSGTEWHAQLTALCTPKLSDSLEGVDPKSVPATRTLGQPLVLLRTDQVAQTAVAADAGTLTLSLTRQDDRWLVDEVDWNRA